MRTAPKMGFSNNQISPAMLNPVTVAFAKTVPGGNFQRVGADGQIGQHITADGAGVDGSNRTPSGFRHSDLDARNSQAALITNRAGNLGCRLRSGHTTQKEP